MYWRTAAAVVLEHHNTDISKVPAIFGQVHCLYTLEDERGPGDLLQTRRQREPQHENSNDVEYQTLRLGVMISSSDLPDEPGTDHSSLDGVLVTDVRGNDYLTIAAHGFPAECGIRVMHPLSSDQANSRHIG